nr:flavodoxin [uncultured Fusobacterium sp.]
MNTVGIFYGTTGGKTKEVVDIIASQLGDAQVFDVADGIDAIEMFDNIILASPTYGAGELQDDWASVIDELADVDFSDKVVAFVGVGDAAIFGANYVESMKHFYDAVEPKGATIVGFTSTDGYDFEASEAVLDDKFVGLAIDASFDEDEIASKVEDWLENKVKDELK